MSRCYAFCLVVALESALAIPAPAVTLSPGDIVVTDFVELDGTTEDGVIFKVDPATGDRTIISGPSVGSGPLLIDPWGILMDTDGSLLVSDVNAGRIFRIDPATGDRQIVSSSSIGAGPDLPFPTGMMLLDDRLLASVVHPSGSEIEGSIYEIDRVTGNRTVISGLGVGNGFGLVEPEGMAPGPNGTIFVGDRLGGAVFQEDRFFESTWQRVIEPCMPDQESAQDRPFRRFKWP